MAKLRPTAYHESGHAVAGIVLGGSFERISLMPRGLTPAELEAIEASGGATHVKLTAGGCVVAMSFATAAQEILDLLAGPLSEARQRRCTRSGYISRRRILRPCTCSDDCR